MYHCLQSKKPVPEIGISLCSDMCKTAPRDRIQNVPIKVEEGLKAEVIEVPEQISFPEIKAESEVNYLAVFSLLHIS